MRPQVREPFRVRQLVASILTLAFLVGAVAALAVLVQRTGFGASAGFGFVVAAAVVWLLIRAMSGSPYRRSAIPTLLRSVAFLLVVLGPVVLVFLAYVPVFVGADKVADERPLLVVAGLLLLLAVACALLGGRRQAK
jgi:hypothetical protein